MKSNFFTPLPYLLLLQVVTAGKLINTSLSTVTIAPTLVKGTESCRVWNHRGGDTMYFHEAKCDTVKLAASEDEVVAKREVSAEGFTFSDTGYRIRFEVSDTGAWRDFEAEFWTKIRPDHIVRCVSEDASEEERATDDHRPRCVVGDRDPKEVKIELELKKKLMLEERQRKLAEKSEL